MPPFYLWCGRQDSNLHAFAEEPKSTESTNSTTPAIASIFYHRGPGVVNGGEREKNCGLFPLTFDLWESKMVSV